MIEQPTFTVEADVPVWQNPDMSVVSGPRSLRRLLVEVRKRKGWSTPAFAELTGVNKGTINEFETGKRQPHRRTLEKIFGYIEKHASKEWLAASVDIIGREITIAESLSHVSGEAKVPAASTDDQIAGHHQVPPQEFPAMSDLDQDEQALVRMFRAAKRGGTADHFLRRAMGLNGGGEQIQRRVRGNRKK